MCAIAGLVSLDAPPDVRPILDAIRHRGPDGLGTHRDGACEIGAARLAIVDPEHGAQPMRDPLSQTAVAFNGEIYNADELRRVLIARGHRFATRCDTEVVLRGFLEWGFDLPAHLSGMYAIAVLESGRLTLIRDPLGIKPLRYAQHGARFAFASEAKALLRWFGPPSLDETALADFIAIGYPTGRHTFFAGISTLPPGHLLTVNWGQGLHVAEPRPYQLRTPPPQPLLCEDEAELAFVDALLAATNSHLQADTEVVAVLSGGIDSAMLACTAAELSGRRLRTFTVADTADHPDAVAAARVARAIGADHTLLTFGFDDYLAAIPATIAAVEAPDLHAGPFFHLLCRVIGGRAKACLNGEGADETLGGYYDPAGTIATLTDGARRATAVGLTPSDRACAIRDGLLEASAKGAAGVRATLDISLQDLLERAQLDPVDHLSMAAGVEMRVPYLDPAVQAVVRRVAPGEIVDTSLGITKRLLRRAAVRRHGAHLLDSALRAKMMMPHASGGHAARFARACDHAVPDDALRRSRFGAGFASKTDFVLFELFRRIHLDGGGAAVKIDDVFAEIAGSSRAAASAVAQAAAS
ncbi:asparagine synthase (glutamine-hydrolyzing) [Rhodopseudomonas sp. NSM]|uniref:asparagine synthase (glutamine-hydrolyzing) n=1 Tax=Rhodopseudomonas sp. NSM TaxID=3457630 RepID=UPI004035ED19